MSLPDPTVVTVPFGDDRKRICKIVSLRDDGFSMTPPAHTSRSGVLFRTPHKSELGTIFFDADKMPPIRLS